ncbi:hypothetical protein ASG32_02920 [Methylobacterium sp. Leaf361]|uniref:hypothetical protein n=1 Tax=Methylobacterium sp. Leaf361 TaxID=1736352 RepID=UPI00070066BA|nr:hypothetical protein [Methylobacterium sp. Leaf361]KQS81718.1 hypothetical protein ASG32_02920 [Methylobacterium sp. Leaf361]
MDRPCLHCALTEFLAEFVREHMSVEVDGVSKVDLVGIAEDLGLVLGEAISKAPTPAGQERLLDTAVAAMAFVRARSDTNARPAAERCH